MRLKEIVSYIHTVRRASELPVWWVVISSKKSEARFNHSFDLRQQLGISEKAFSLAFGKRKQVEKLEAASPFIKSYMLSGIAVVTVVSIDLEGRPMAINIAPDKNTICSHDSIDFLKRLVQVPNTKRARKEYSFIVDHHPGKNIYSSNDSIDFSKMLVLVPNGETGRKEAYSVIVDHHIIPTAKEVNASGSNTRKGTVALSGGCPHINVTEQATPFSKGLATSFPRLSSVPLSQRKSCGSVKWNSGVCASQRTIVASAEKLEVFLNTISSQNQTTAAEILKNLLNRANMNSVSVLVKKNMATAGVSDKENTNPSICVIRGVRDFLNHHTTTGRRVAHVQDAIDAVITAACFSRNNVTSRQSVADAIGRGTRPSSLKFYEDKGRNMKLSNSQYEPETLDKRSDRIRDEAQACVLEWCHSEEGTMLDTESYRCYLIKDTISGVVEKHPVRVFKEVTMEKRFNSFLESSVYASFQSFYSRNIGKEVFRLSLCRCVRDPSPESCTDLIFSSLQEYMYALRTATQFNKVIKARVLNCQCNRHVQAREADTFGENCVNLMWEDKLSSRPSDFIKLTCCEAISEPTLRRSSNEGKIPRIISWKCTHQNDDGTPQCLECGIQKKLKLSECDCLTSCSIPIKVMEWKLAPRAGKNKKGEQNTQIELSESSLPIKEVVNRLATQLTIARTHFSHGNWLNMTRRLDTNTFSTSELLVFTDFSATMDLHAAKADNSSVNNHAVLAIYVVLYSPRDVNVKLDNGEVQTKRVNECDVWYFFGESMSKGKKNDHVFHNACLKEIVRYYKRRFKREKKGPIRRVLIWTDNCACQYKCNQNFFQIACFAHEVDGIQITHRFAQKYMFKGVWDAAGKVIKATIRDLELEKVRFPNGFACYEKLRAHLSKIKTKKPWNEFEKNGNPKLLLRTPFTVSRRLFGFGTENKDEFEQLKNQYRHIVFTDRVNIPKMKRIDGTQKLHEVVGGTGVSRTIEGGKVE